MKVFVVDQALRSLTIQPRFDPKLQAHPLEHDAQSAQPGPIVSGKYARRAVFVK